MTQQQGSWGKAGGGYKGGNGSHPYKGGKGGKGGDDPGPNYQLYITSLPGDANQEELERVFNQYGVVKHVKICWQDAAEGCTALIRFSGVEEATQVKEALHGNLPQGLERSP